jgi:hypothetical protein
MAPFPRARRLTHRPAQRRCAGRRLDHLVIDWRILAQPIQGPICAELPEVYRIASGFKATVMRAFDARIARAGGMPPAVSA